MIIEDYFCQLSIISKLWVLVLLKAPYRPTSNAYFQAYVLCRNKKTRPMINSKLSTFIGLVIVFYTKDFV